MKLLSKVQVKAWDAFTIKENNISSFMLMENASKVFTNWFQALYFDKSRHIHVLCGSGNNGGDGLCIARLLSNLGYIVETHLYLFSRNQSIDNKKNQTHLPNVNIHKLPELGFIEHDAIVIDAILGSGINGKLKGPYLLLIDALNLLKNTVVSVDTPSGLQPDAITEGSFVQSNNVLSFEIPKIAFFLEDNNPHIQKWDFRSIGLSASFLERADTFYHYLTYSDIKAIVIPRTKFQSKFNFGFGQLCGGSEGMFGAIVLSARAAMKSGIGRLAANIPDKYVAAFITAVPEAMTTPLTIDNESNLNHFSVLSKRIDAIAIGPGLGKGIKAVQYIDEALKQISKSLILDADALNIIANNNWQERIPNHTIITPHTKEFESLFGVSKNHFKRIELQKHKATELSIFIVLKGSHTTIACPDGNCYFNSTGNVGMATAGSGDVLTGMMLAFLSQGYTAKETCILSVYSHGASGDLAALKYGQISMIASDIIEYIPETLKNLHGK